jgi:hypothetical protein
MKCVRGSLLLHAWELYDRTPLKLYCIGASHCVAWCRLDITGKMLCKVEKYRDKQPLAEGLSETMALLRPLCQTAIQTKRGFVSKRQISETIFDRPLMVLC